jgi:hypothetical protein
MKKSILAAVTAFCAMLASSSLAQTAAADNKISQSGTFHPIHMDATVFGVFQGRPACTGTANQLGVEIPADCDKLKWSLTLYRDTVTQQPATYELSIVGGGDVVRTDGGSYRMKILEGKWNRVKGTRSNPNAEVYELELPKPGKNMHLLKGDENVLFVLDENRDFLVGDMDFSYTLNRVELVQAKK